MYVYYILIMVKNKKGGSSHKKMARKNVAPKGGYHNRKIRKPVENGEIFARVTAIHGGGHAGILCADGKVRTLVIRGKFRGRNKRNNTIRVNTIILAALRSVTMGEIVSAKKKEKADLIYVYNESQMDELKEIPEVYKIFDDTKKSQIKEEIDCGFEFSDKIIDNNYDDKNLNIKIENKKESLFKEDDVDIDWDDI